MTRALPRLHAVTDDGVLALPHFTSRLRAIAAAGDVAIHLRTQVLSPRRRVRWATRFLQTGAVVLINDRVDVALVTAASGVHLPEHGLAVRDARAILGDDAVIGCSAHTPEAALLAHEEGADYVFLGPIWETSSHPQRTPLGAAAIDSAAPATVIAIGGVTAERVAACLDHGAYGVAAIGALWAADDPGAAAEAMLVSLER